MLTQPTRRTHFTVNLREDLRKRLENLALSAGISRSEAINQLLEKAIAQHELPDSAKDLDAVALYRQHVKDHPEDYES